MTRKAKLTIRTEKEEDKHSIHKLISSAFKNHPHSSQKEHLLVSGLRDDGALAVSLLAETDGKIVGHIAFSEVMVNNERMFWYGLAPVSVIPQYQNQGIGSKLIIEGLETVRKLGAKGCVLLGEPGYYERFGFRRYKKLILKNVPPEYFLVLAFQSEIPEGIVSYHELFTKFG